MCVTGTIVAYVALLTMTKVKLSETCHDSL